MTVHIRIFFNPYIWCEIVFILSLKSATVNEVCFWSASGQVKGQNSFRLDDGVQKSLKKPRLVFTEIQRRTLVAIFKEIKRPSKEIQATIAEQLGLKTSTVANFFMNARRRSIEKYMDEEPNSEQISNLASVTSSQNSNDMIDQPDSL